MGKIYPEGIHSAIAGKLSAFENFNVRTATLDMPQHGLTDEVLDNTDVLIWWGGTQSTASCCLTNAMILWK